MADGDDITFGELRDALIPPGTDGDALWAALKASRIEGPDKAEFLGKIREFHQTGGHVPGSVGIAPDPSFAPPRALPPPDRDSPMVRASVAANELYHSLLAGGFTVDEATTIVAKLIAFRQVMDSD